MAANLDILRRKADVLAVFHHGLPLGDELICDLVIDGNVLRRCDLTGLAVLDPGDDLSFFDLTQHHCNVVLCVDHSSFHLYHPYL